MSARANYDPAKVDHFPIKDIAHLEVQAQQPLDLLACHVPAEVQVHRQPGRGQRGARAAVKQRLLGEVGAQLQRGADRVRAPDPARGTRSSSALQGGTLRPQVACAAC